MRCRYLFENCTQASLNWRLNWSFGELLRADGEVSLRALGELLMRLQKCCMHGAFALAQLLLLLLLLMLRLMLRLRRLLLLLRLVFVGLKGVHRDEGFRFVRKPALNPSD